MRVKECLAKTTYAKHSPPSLSLCWPLTPCADEEHEHVVSIRVELLYPCLPVLVGGAPVESSVHVAFGPHEALSYPRVQGAGERQTERARDLGVVTLTHTRGG